MTYGFLLSLKSSKIPFAMAGVNNNNNIDMAWINNKKAYDIVPQKLDNKMSQNEQHITGSHKLYRENHENLESGIDSKRTKLR